MAAFFTFLFFIGGFPGIAYLYLYCLCLIITVPYLFPRIWVNGNILRKRNMFGFTDTVDLNTLANFRISRQFIPTFRRTFVTNANIAIRLEDKNGHAITFPILCGFWGERSFWQNDGDLQVILNSALEKNHLDYDDFAKKMLKGIDSPYPILERMYGSRKTDAMLASVLLIVAIAAVCIVFKYHLLSR